MKTTENTLALIKENTTRRRRKLAVSGRRLKSIDKFTRPLSMAHDAAKTWNEADKINTEWTENRRYFVDLGKNISASTPQPPDTLLPRITARSPTNTGLALRIERSKFNNALR